MSDKRLLMPPEMAQIVLEYNLNGQVAESVLYSRHETSPDLGITWGSAAYENGDLQPLADQVYGWVTAHLKNNMAIQTEVTGIKVTRNTNVPGGPLVQIADGTNAYPVVGINSAALPNNVTIAVEHTTAFLGRSYRGRTYQPGLNIAYVDTGAGANVLNATGEAQILDTWNEFRTTLATGYGLEGQVRDHFVIASFVSGGAPRAVAIHNDVVNSVFSDLNLDSMKDRLPGK